MNESRHHAELVVPGTSSAGARPHTILGMVSDNLDEVSANLGVVLSDLTAVLHNVSWCGHLAAHWCGTIWGEQPSLLRVVLDNQGSAGSSKGRY